ncbi:MAG: AMP-binding protein [Thermoguttaceae bacterium]
MTETYPIPQREMLRVFRKYPLTKKYADSTGKELTSNDAFIAILVVRRLINRLLSKDEKNVGLLFPTSVYGVIINAALALDKRVAVNLNYTFGQEALNFCVQKAEIKHIFTTKRLLERFPNLKLDANIIVLEDVVKQITVFDKISGWIDARITPLPVLEWKLGLNSLKPEDPLTIIFTSGSTGQPKGVVISNENLSSNVAGFHAHLLLTPEDKVYGILPLFHAFGLSTTVWITLMRSVGGVYHFNPLDPKKVGEVARKYRPTIMPSTATFQRSYLRRCPKEDFDFIKTVICGAEKLPGDLTDAWEEKFGHRISEGYGATELSPVVSTNIDKYRRKDYEKWRREGSVGRPFYNMQTRVVDLDTGEVLPPDTPGMLQIKGPNVMLGYFKDPEKTAQVIKDGWYTTGDVARVDADGFIWITGRESRMSKIGGEMVPHILVEDIISRIVNEATQSDATQTAQEIDDSQPAGVQFAVSGVADEKKGEKLVVLYTQLPLSPEDICKKIQADGLPNHWIPNPQNFRQVPLIPVLGTGKLDLRRVKELAVQEFGS